uniref:EF-hand domain-containing protein n=1 Tax=Pyrodinium bahamense TaxID=73915 RepID=A0A7S0BBQ4_9DINO
MAPVSSSSIPVPRPDHSQASHETLKKIFSLCDKDGNGRINKRELIKICRCTPSIAQFFGLPEQIRQEDGSRSVVEQWFQQVDANDDREISWEEFLAFYKKRPGSTSSPNLRAQAHQVQPSSGPCAITDGSPFGGSFHSHDGVSIASQVSHVLRNPGRPHKPHQPVDPVDPFPPCSVHRFEHTVSQVQSYGKRTEASQDAQHEGGFESVAAAVDKTGAEGRQRCLVQQPAKAASDVPRRWATQWSSRTSLHSLESAQRAAFYYSARFERSEIARTEMALRELQHPFSKGTPLSPGFY